MTGYWLAEGAGYWLALAIASGVAVWAGMASKHTAVAFLAFSLVVICCLLLNHSVMKMVGMPEAEESDERLASKVFGFLIAMFVSAVVVSPVMYFIFRICKAAWRAAGGNPFILAMGWE